MQTRQTPDLAAIVEVGDGLLSKRMHDGAHRARRLSKELLEKSNRLRVGCFCKGLYFSAKLLYMHRVIGSLQCTARLIEETKGRFPSVPFRRCL